MAQLPCSGDISLPGTLNQINWTVIVSDSDYFLLEVGLAPGPSAATNVSGLVGLLASTTELLNASPSGNGTNQFTSTNKTFPKNFEQIWIGDISLAPPLITLDLPVNNSWKELLAAIPVDHPPIIHRGEILVLAAKNLTAQAYHVQWNVNARKISDRARALIEYAAPPPIAPFAGPASEGDEAPPFFS